MPEAAGIYYTVYEGGEIDLPPVILIHGAGGSHVSWPAEMRRLAGQQVFALDLPGHGKSRGFAQQSIPAYADLIHNFLTELGLTEAVLVGHSMGGAIALTLALKYPRQVAGLGLLASGAFLGVETGFLDELGNPLTVPSGLQRLQNRIFSPSTSAAVIDTAMRSLRELRPSLLLADWLACAAFDLREMVDQVHAPAWIAYGSDDRLIPISYSHFLAAHLPVVKLQVVPAAGHMLMVEQPRLLTQGLCDFLTLQLPVIQSYRWDLHRMVQPAEKR